MEFVQPLRRKTHIEALRAELKRRNPRDHAMFVLGIATGLRISDLLTLTVGDVVEVLPRRAAKDRLRIARRLSLRERKTGKTKSFPLNREARSALRSYLRDRVYRFDEPLFVSRKAGGDGDPRAISRQHAWHILNEAAHAVGVAERIGTHSLRKTFGYLAFLAGVDVTRIQQLLNHASPATTLAYIGITQDELDQVYINIFR